MLLGLSEIHRGQGERESIFWIEDDAGLGYSGEEFTDKLWEPRKDEKIASACDGSIFLHQVEPRWLMRWRVI